MTNWRPLFEQQANLSNLFAFEALSAALALSRDAICGCNKEGEIFIANKAFSELVGLSAAKALTDNIKNFLFTPDGILSRREDLLLKTGNAQKSSQSADSSLSRSQDASLPFVADGKSVTLLLRKAHSPETTEVSLTALPIGKDEDTFLVSIIDKTQKKDSALDATQILLGAHVLEEAAKNRLDAKGKSSSQTVETFEGNARIVENLMKAVGAGDPSGIYSVLASEIQEAVAADGAAVFMADAEGYHLRATKGILSKDNLPAFLSKKDPLARLTEKPGATVRYTLAHEFREPSRESTDPTRDSAASSKKTTDSTKESVEPSKGMADATQEFSESTKEVSEPIKRDATKKVTANVPAKKCYIAWLQDKEEPLHVRVELAPALASFFLVPVIFDNTIVAFTVAGWKDERTLSLQSAHVLDLLSAHYANEILTASVSLKAAMSEDMKSTSDAIWSSLEQHTEAFTEPDIQHLFHSYAQALEADFIAFFVNEETRARTAIVNEKDFYDVNLTLFDFYDEAQKETESREGAADLSSQESVKDDLFKRFETPLADVKVLPFDVDSKLSAWTKEVLAEPLQGAVFVIPQILGKRHTVAIGRAATADPLSQIEITLYKRFLQDLCLFVQEKNKSAQDIYVSKMLQAGLENKTQKVEGLTVRPLYNSATAAADIGGDFYDVISLPNHKACIIMGDVAGKGVGSAAISSAVRTALGAYAWEGLFPAHMVRSLNDFFLGFSRLETFATIFVGHLDLKTGHLVYCSAGHPPSILLHPHAAQLETLDVQSGVVGAFREMIYKEGERNLSRGDTLFLYTDGVTEARKPKTGDFFGELALQELLLRHISDDSETLPDTVLRELFEFSQNSLGDDIAMMSLRFDGLEDSMR